MILEGIEFAHSLKWRGDNEFLVNSTIYHEASLIKNEDFTYCEIGSGADYECITWIAKCQLNIGDVVLKCQRPKEDSMLIANELVYAVEEFAQDKMIATVTPKDLFIIHGW